jgi:tyrosine-protein kinase Etk/Wzc
MIDTQSQLEMDTEQEISLLKLLQLLVKHKMLIVKMCCISLVASLIYSILLPNIYTSTAKIMPPQKETAGGLSALLGQAGGLAGLAAASGFTGGGDLYLGILKSRSVADAVIKRLNLMEVYEVKNLEAARKKLDGAVKVQAGKDGIITITTDDRDPKRSALLANTMIDELGKTTVRLNLTKAGTERVFLEKRLELVKKDLKTAEEELKSFAQNNKIVQVDSQARASIESISRLKAELAKQEVQLAVVSSNQTAQSPEVRAIETGIRQLKGELGVLAGSAGGGEGIPSLGNVPSVGLAYARKLRELKIQEAVFEQLTKQYEMAKLNEAKDSSTFQVLDEAVVPIRKSKPSRSLIVIMSTAATFLISVVVVCAREYLAKLPAEDRAIVDDILMLRVK